LILKSLIKNKKEIAKSKMINKCEDIKLCEKIFISQHYANFDKLN